MERTRTLWTPAFVLAALVNFLHSMGFFVFVNLSGWLAGREADEFQIGVLVATLAVTAILARPFVGRVMDTRGRRIVVIAGGFVHVAATGAFVWLDAASVGGGPTIWALVGLVRLIHGIAEAMLFSVLFTMAADLVPVDRRAQGIALFGISGLLPLAIGGLLGDLLIVGTDHGALFVVSAGCAVAGLLGSFALPETLQPSAAVARGYWAAVGARELRSVAFMGLAFATGLVAYFTFLKTFLLERPELGTMSGFFLIYALAASAVRLFLGWVPERIGLRRTLIPALGFAVIGLLVLAQADSPIDLTLAGLLCGIGHAYAFPILSTLVVIRARPEERGSAISMFTALSHLGQLIGGPLFGGIAMLVDYPGTFASAALLIASATAGFVFWERLDGIANRAAR